jgi:uncharacterized membrane-anchored protein
MSKKIYLIAFLVLAIVQLSIPINMILGNEEVIDRGTLFKFQLEPIDPVDPFRGKFITLNFTDNTFPVEAEDSFKRNDQIYVQLTKNDDGFAVPSGVSREIPEGDYVLAYVRKLNWLKTKMTIAYPFDRFYMHEDKAKPAEKVLGGPRDSLIVYAEVSILNGMGVLNDVKVGDVPLQEYLKN